MSSLATRRGLKLPARLQPVAFAFFMSALMAAVMCSAIVALNLGIDEHYLARVASVYARAMPIAFLSVLALRPLVLRLVRLTVHPA